MAFSRTSYRYDLEWLNHVSFPLLRVYCVETGTTTFL